MPSSPRLAAGSHAIALKRVISATRAQQRQKKAKRSSAPSLMTLWHCWSESFPGTASHGRDGAFPPAAIRLEMVGLRPTAAGFGDQLYGSADVGECRRPRYDTLSPQGRPIWQYGIGLRLGFCHWLDGLWDCSRSHVGALALPCGSAALVLRGLRYRTCQFLWWPVALPDIARIV